MTSEENKNNEVQPFPLHHLMPKRETQQESFLSRFPNYDGRGIVMAVLDTGVDPAMPGMQVTSTGERKLLHVSDCSGANDVDCSMEKKAVNGVVEGRTGRKLQIPSEWTNPSGKWYVGLKHIYELYPSSVATRVKREMKEEVWRTSQSLALADAQRQLSAHEEKVGATSDKLSEKLNRDNLTAQVDFLRAQEKVEQKGPVADVLSWHDGHTYLAVLDTSYNGDLSGCTPMASYREKGEYQLLSQRDGLTFSFNILNFGKTVEITVPIGSHGSHVANIAGGHFPDAKDKDGLAPGVKIISYSIGDIRLGTMETGSALTRAFDACALEGVDIVNMSFGEGVHMPNTGRIVEELKKVVEKHNVVFVSSAGNSGPALSTAGAPGATTDSVLGIGAYMVAETGDPQYGAFSKNIQPGMYNWSSRGPAHDGALGVCVSAPGAAVTGVPKYTRYATQLMNGTSMSSPNAAGAIACLLSALKAEGRKYSVAQIRLALENTASLPEGASKLNMGHGMLQIEKAYEWLKKTPPSFLPFHLKRFEVRITRAPGNTANRGIYLRDECDTGRVHETSLIVQPKFGEEDCHAGVEFEKFTKVQVSVPWLRTPDNLVLTNQACRLACRVDPTQLPEGLHYTEIHLIDSEYPEAGPIVRIPVTVCIPAKLGEKETKLTYEASIPQFTVDRKFIAVPEGATAALLQVKNVEQAQYESFVVHCTQLHHNTCIRDTEVHRLVTGELVEWQRGFGVVGGKTLEVAIARPWTREMSTFKVSVEVEFFGVSSTSPLFLGNANVCNSFTLQAWKRAAVEVKPSVQLKYAVQVLRPTEAKLQPLFNRDVFIDGTVINRLLLSYKLSVAKSGDFHMDVGGLCEFLYDAPLDCILIQVFTTTKEPVGFGSSFSNRYTIKLEKGEYRIHVQLRHPNEQVLDKMRDTPLSVQCKLSSAITLDLFPSASALIEGSASKLSSARVLPAGHSLQCFVAAVPDDKLIKGMGAGSYFKGYIQPFDNSELSLTASAGIPVHFTLNEYGKRQTKALSTVTLAVKKTNEQEYSDALRDLRIEWLEKSKKDEMADSLYDTLTAEHSTHIQVHMAMLRRLAAKKKQTRNDVDRMFIIMGELENLIKPDEVLRWLGAKHEHDEENIALKSSMDERKNAMVDVCLVRGTLIADAFIHANPNSFPPSFKKKIAPTLEKKVDEGKKDEEKKEESEVEERPAPDENGTEEKSEKKREDKDNSATPQYAASMEEWNAAMKELYKWMDPTDAKALLLSAKHAAALSHLGRAAKYLSKLVDDTSAAGKDSSAYEEMLADVCETLGWDHVAHLYRNRIAYRHRAVLRAF